MRSALRRFASEQAARRRAIEPMSELELLHVGPQQPQRLDAAQADAAAAVDGEARGLVEHEQPRVLVHDALAEPIEAVRRRDGLGRRRTPTGGTRTRSPACRR